MEIGDRLRIYKGILGNKCNPLDVRFKLVKIFHDNVNSVDLYCGLRVDNRAFDCVTDEEVNISDVCYTGDTLMIKPSIFIRLASSEYFCDMFDDYRVCTLVDQDNYSVHHGCCSVSKISPKELVKFRSDESFIKDRRK